METELARLKVEEAQTLVQKELEIKESSEALKQQMLHKIRLKKAELFSLKKDNFGEDIEVVIQQNYHYTNQLDYQTKHFEHLILQNEKLKMQLEGMVSNYEIHKKIQTELAKRIFLSSQIVEEIKKKNGKLDEKRLRLSGKLEALAEESRKGEGLRSHKMMMESKREDADREVDGLRQVKGKLVSENVRIRGVLTGYHNNVLFLEEVVAKAKGLGDQGVILEALGSFLRERRFVF